MPWPMWEKAITQMPMLREKYCTLQCPQMPMTEVKAEFLQPNMKQEQEENTSSS